MRAADLLALRVRARVGLALTLALALALALAQALALALTLALALVLTLALSLTVGERHPRAGRSAEVAEIRPGVDWHHRYAGPERVRPLPPSNPAPVRTPPPLPPAWLSAWLSRGKGRLRMATTRALSFAHKPTRPERLAASVLRRPPRLRRAAPPTVRASTSLPGPT